MAQIPLLDTPYAAYLGAAQLFELQGEMDALHHPDEFQFRTVHLASELWLRLAAAELERAAGALDGDLPLVGLRRLERAGQALGLLVDQLSILETMAVSDYHQFRLALGNASGLQSPGYALVRRAAKPLLQAFAGALERRGAALADVYRRHEEAGLLELHLVGEKLYAIDVSLNRFLYGHLLTARRFLGDTAAGTGGKAVDYLRGGVEHVLFAPLWEVRGAIASEFGSVYAGGEG